MDQDKSEIDPSSASSPSTEEASCRDFISSYTQISNVNDLTSQHTDIDSSDDEDFLVDDLNCPKPLGDTNLPQLSTQIIEWSKGKFQDYENEELQLKIDDNKIDSNLLSETTSTSLQDDMSESSYKRHNDEKFCFVQMKLLENVETYTKTLASNLNSIMEFVSNSSSKVTATSVKSISMYEANLNEVCESVDSDIKLMYKIIAKCEELNKSLNFINNLSLQIREVKQTLEQFERTMDKS